MLVSAREQPPRARTRDKDASGRSTVSRRPVIYGRETKGNTKGERNRERIRSHASQDTKSTCGNTGSVLGIRYVIPVRGIAALLSEAALAGRHGKSDKVGTGARGCARRDGGYLIYAIERAARIFE